MTIGGVEVRCLNRFPLSKSTKSEIDLGAVVSPNDRIADIDPDLYRGEPTHNDADRRRVRRNHGQGQGLVLIYPLAADAPLPENSKRIPMPVDFQQVAFAIVCPYIAGADSNDVFVSVKPNWDVPNYTEDEEQEELMLLEETD